MTGEKKQTAYCNWEEALPAASCAPRRQQYSVQKFLKHTSINDQKEDHREYASVIMHVEPHFVKTVSLYCTGITHIWQTRWLLRESDPPRERTGSMHGSDRSLAHIYSEPKAPTNRYIHLNACSVWPVGVGRVWRETMHFVFPPHSLVLCKLPPENSFTLQHITGRLHPAHRKAWRNTVRCTI